MCRSINQMVLFMTRYFVVCNLASLGPILYVARSCNTIHGMKYSISYQCMILREREAFTLRSKRSAIQVAPSAASQAEVFCICPPILFHISRNCDPLAGMPRISFICEVTIIRATADVKPELTGPDTKSIKNPEINTRLLERVSWRCLKLV